MSIFKTPTPAYKGQTGAPASRLPAWVYWIKQLFKTPTPQYHKAPTHSARVSDNESR